MTKIKSFKNDFLIMENFINPKQVYADLRSDFMFKKAFGQKHIMIPFLNSILRTDRIYDIDYRNIESSGLTKDDRKVFYDIYCHSSDGRDFIVEMQRIGLKYYRDRVLFYATYPIIKQHTEAKQKFLAHNHDEKFNWDYHLYPVYVISIVDFVMEHCESWPKDRFHSHYIMKEEEYNEPYSNNLHFLFIELPRFNKVLQNLSDESEKWAYLFQNLSQLKDIPVEFDENYFTDLFLTAKIANFTPDEKEKYTEDQKMIYDYQNCIDFAVEKAAKENLAKGLAEGEAKGKAEGEKLAKLETARNLLKMGLSVSQISLATGLSESEINELIDR